MKKFVKLSLAIVPLAFLASSAANAATPGGYVGGGLGVSLLDTPNDSLIKDDTAKFYKQAKQRGGFGARLFGGYNFNEYLGVEAGVSQYARSHYHSNLVENTFGSLTKKKEYSMTAGDLVAKAYLPLGQSGFNVYALGGVALAHSKINGQTKVVTPVANGASGESRTQNKLRPKYGVGASFDIPETKFATNLEWSRIQGTGNVKNSVRAIPSADLLTINLSYKFD